MAFRFQNLDHLNQRMISKTPFLSKLVESFISDWLLEIIKPYLDPDQCGMKGLSITHYLLKFLHYIQSSLDSTLPTGVVAAFIDLSKAFNRVDHNSLFQDLYDMNCPSWLLREISLFITKVVIPLKNHFLVALHKGPCLG